MLIYHLFCLCMHLGSCWTQVFWDGNDHMANTLKINSTCPASRAHHTLLMVLFFFFSVLDNGNRTTAFVRVWFIADTIYDWCCTLPAEFGYFAKAVISWPHFFQRLSHKKPKQKKKQLCYCFRCCERAHKKRSAAAPELCWCALSWALGVYCARDVQGWQQFVHSPVAVCTPHTSQNS